MWVLSSFWTKSSPESGQKVQKHPPHAPSHDSKQQSAPWCSPRWRWITENQLFFFSTKTFNLGNVLRMCDTSSLLHLTARYPLLSRKLKTNKHNEHKNQRSITYPIDCSNWSVNRRRDKEFLLIQQALRKWLVCINVLLRSANHPNKSQSQRKNTTRKHIQSISSLVHNVEFRLRLNKKTK